ncbi:MAG: tRNA (guanosine(46)-N7)-methyltransferase TrmB [Pseudomonadales bacterium]|nr:tRNA (guanosine(46)-N7)-methyltransferase TrmB [Pseudomonadales bacterium]
MNESPVKQTDTRGGTAISEPEQYRPFLRRRGRITRGQQRALESLSARYCVDVTHLTSIDATLFGRAAPVGLEIGFGMGHALLDWACQAPEWNLLGIEVYQPGIGALLLGVERLEIDNVRVIESPAEVALARWIAEASLDEVRIFFPDPWPKKRHHKRRLLQPDFAALLCSRLRPGGRLLLATDWEPYAHWMYTVLEQTRGLINVWETQFGPRAEERPITNFEARGQRLGHAVWDLEYRRES